MYYHPDVRDELPYSNDTWPIPDYKFTVMLSDLSVPGNGFQQDPQAEDIGGYLLITQLMVETGH